MKKTKKIAAITMARNDEFFLTKWTEYYGHELGIENLYIILDGTNQKEPQNAMGANIIKLPHTDMSRTAGDKYRIGKISNLANELFKKYDIVIGCDSDEFLVVDPNTKKSLCEYLSELKYKTTVSGLGLDIGQNMKNEKPLDISKPMLVQREYALLSTRYTKPVVLFRPAHWGSGFHHVKGHNFHIDSNLYLLHFGAVDMEMLVKKAVKRGPDWVNHLRRRGNGTINIITKKNAHGTGYIKIARTMQRIFRPIYAPGKPGMLGIKWVVKIPQQFKKTGI
ncbi:MAG: glycosyltransferase family 2 protein [Alphaproteobacteria bacterium]|nr:glycosyltransferase family 2 protein [Alphaproteobacteria bacterium]